MTEKNGFAQVLDKLVEGLNKAKKNGSSISTSSDVANVLPKPTNQNIGDGVIVWQWMVPGEVIVEAVLATRTHNQSSLEKGEYVVGVQFPESENATYALYGDSAKDVGQAILSAWNWKNIWRLHAGDFLLEELSWEPQPPVEVETSAPAPQVAETIDVDSFAVETTPSFDEYPIGNVQG
jgi:hypothetical protein